MTDSRSVEGNQFDNRAHATSVGVRSQGEDPNEFKTATSKLNDRDSPRLLDVDHSGTMAREQLSMDDAADDSYLKDTIEKYYSK